MSVFGFAPPSSRVWVAGAALCLALAPLVPADAQSLAAQRESVFSQMIAAPADRALMSEYARLSIEMRDYEAAAATLERLIDLEPGNTRARLDLAIAYFALGSYEVAEYHLAAASASGGLGTEDLAAVEAYRAEAERRSAPSRFEGEIAAGIVSADGDHGPLLSGEVTWRYDLGDANATDWVTEAAFSSFQIGADRNDPADDTQAFRLRSGPELRLTGEAFGATLQPYLQLESLRFDDASRDYDAAFFGVAYQNPINAIWTVFADAAAGSGELRQSGNDIDFHRTALGVTIRPDSAWMMRVTLSHEREDAPGREETSHGVRLDYGRSFEAPGLPAITEWTGGGFAGLDWVDIDRRFFAPRDETVHSAGLFLRGHLQNDLFIETRATHLSREGGNDASVTIVSLQLGWEF